MHTHIAILLFALLDLVQYLDWLRNASHLSLHRPSLYYFALIFLSLSSSVSVLQLHPSLTLMRCSHFAFPLISLHIMHICFRITPHHWSFLHHMIALL